MKKDISEMLANLSQKDLEKMQDTYLFFTSNFMEYVREIDPVLFKRALDYAAHVTNENE